MMPVLDTLKRRAQFSGRRSPLAGQISSLYFDGNNNATKKLCCWTNHKPKKAKAYIVKAGVYNDSVGGQSVVINVSDMLYQVEDGTEHQIEMRTGLTPSNYLASHRYCSDTNKNLVQLLEVMSKLGYMVEHGQLEGEPADIEENEPDEKDQENNDYLEELLELYNRMKIAVIFFITEICPCFDIDFMD